MQPNHEISPKCQRLIDKVREICTPIDRRDERAILEQRWRIGRVLVEIHKDHPGAGVSQARKQIPISRTEDFYCRKIAGIEWRELAQFENKVAALRRLGVKFTGHRLQQHDELTPKNACLTAMHYIQRSTDPARAAALLIKQATEFLARN
jgi:hypothetical protein